MVEKLKVSNETLSTPEYAKEWTEKSPNSKLNVIKRIFNNHKLDNIPEVKKIKDKLLNRDYREVQRLTWIKLRECDWKLWKNSLAYIGNYINKLKASQRITSNTGGELWHLSWDIIGIIQNQVDTTQIQQNEAQYLATHESMSQSEYNRLFSWKERLKQWQLWDCYLVSWIHELSNAQHFDTLMRTSIQRVKRNNGDLGYQIKIPLWEPSWRKIFLKNSEIPVAKINWNTGYKLLELAYAKNKLRKNDKNGNKYSPITSSELNKISWWRTHEVLQTFIWKNNIWFNDFWTMKNYRNWKNLSQSPQNAKSQIHNFLKNYIPSIGNKFVSLASLPWSSDRKSYTIWWKTIYRKHAYSLTWVKKDNKWEIISITVLNPRNNWSTWWSTQEFSLIEFFQAFSAISCGKIKTKTFLDNKTIS